MPGDLRDPEQTYPFYHDNLYRRGPSQFEPGSSDMDKYLQSIAFERYRIKLSPEKLEDLKNELSNKGFFFQNPGTEEFRAEVCKLMKRYKLAERIARKWLT